ncbi:MAG TPA: PAS domain S-box protein [Roseiflexaceae bacterium]|nr:PAS domain S-box protein [Roseiflexaceae bacterium]
MDRPRTDHSAGVWEQLHARPVAPTAAHEAAFLAAISDELAQSLDADTTLRHIAALVVPSLADWCHVDIITPDGGIRRVAGTHVDPSRQPLIDQICAYTPSRSDHKGIALVLADGVARVLNGITEEGLAAASSSPEELGILRALAPRAVLIVPLTARGSVLGTLTLVMAESGRSFRPQDQTLAEDLARRAALAFDNARLYQHARTELAERQRVEQALRDSEERFRRTFEQAAVGMAHVGLDGRWQWVNRHLCEILGYTYEQLLERTFQDITHPDDLDADLALVQQLLAGEISSYSLEKRYLCADGGALWTQLTVALVRDGDGEPDYFVSVVENITAQKAAEARIRNLNATLEGRVRERTAQLEQANQALQAFASTVAHDLRAPLRSMQGFAQILEEDYGEHLDEEGHSYVRHIVEAAHDMDRLIQDLLAYSRISQAEIPLQQVDLDRVVADALGAVAGLSRERQARITVEHPLPAVHGHPGMLVQVLGNLLANALTFTTPDTPPQVHIRAERRGSRVRLWVEDNGIGIAPEHHERIFRVFERLHGVERYPGTGIGLAIVQQGIARMGGQVGVESQLGRGSRFWIELTERAAHDDHQPPDHVAPGRG